MKYNLYCIHDSKAEIYNAPFHLQNDHVAIRTFTDLVNDPQSQIFKHPADYILFRLGEFDDQTAKIKTDFAPKNLGVGIQFVKKPELTGDSFEPTIDELPPSLKHQAS